MKQIQLSDVIKITSCKTDLLPADEEVLSRFADILPVDLISIMREWGIGYFGDQDVRFHPPRDYFSEALPDDSNNPHGTYGGRTYRRECVVGSVQGGYEIIVRNRCFFLFNRFKGVLEEVPLIDVTHLLSFCIGGGMAKLSKDWDNIRLRTYYVSPLDFRALRKEVKRGTQVSKAIKVFESFESDQGISFWSISQRCISFPDREALIAVDTANTRSCQSLSLIANYDKIDPSDVFWQRMWNAFE
jgi:hypothetical protein